MLQNTSNVSAPRATAPPLIDVCGASLRYGTTEIFRDIDLAVAAGSFVCLVGPSGCGKTTLLRMMGGLATPSAGSIRFKDRTVTEPQAEVAFVFQDYGRALLPWRTVFGNVALALEASGMARERRSARVAELLELLGLRAHAEHFPAQLSGGLQQRVQIARALAQEPEVMLMDEPFGALDAITRGRLQDELAGLWTRMRTTIVFVTHDLDEAIYLGDRVIVLDAHPGRVAADLEVQLPRPRSQLATREDERFLAYRHRLFGLLA
jgi:NitT/TauT family transport system ATP-binding protein